MPDASTWCSRAVAVGVAALLVLPACGADDDADASDLPPGDKDGIGQVFEPALDELGVRLTRGALIDRDDGYRRSDDGRHLAVYVEPAGAYSPVDYASGIVTTARAFLPAVFERWPGLESFDVCQEPRPGMDDRAEPPPVTQLFVTRDEAEAIDWETVTPAELLALVDPVRDSYTLYVAPELSLDPEAAALLSAPVSGTTPAPPG